MKKRLENRWEVGVWRESGMWRQTCVLINSEIYRWKTERESAKEIMGDSVCIDTAALHTLLPSPRRCVFVAVVFFVSENIAKITLMTFHAIFIKRN